jgi:hypothetical protein
MSSSSSGAAHIVALLPASAETRASDQRPVARAIEEARFYSEESGSGGEPREASVFVDKEVGVEVVELVGKDVRLSFGCRCSLPFLVAHVRDIGRWCAVEVEVVDESRRVRTIVATNRASVARISADRAVLPLLLLPRRWNRICLDLEDICAKAFGQKYTWTRHVRVDASLRVARIYFADAHYEDRALPPFLRVVPPDA